jgi:hypothetical protein
MSYMSSGGSGWSEVLEAYFHDTGIIVRGVLYFKPLW